MPIEAFIANLKRRGASRETEIAYRSDLKLFTDFVGARNLHLDAVKPTDIDDYVSYLRQRPGRGGNHASVGSIRRRLSVVSSLYEFLRMYTNGAVTNPITRFARPKMSRRKPSPINGPAAAQLQEVGNLRDRAILSVFLASAVRLSELHQLNRDSISVVEQYDELGNSTVLGTAAVIGKGGKQREVLIDVSTLEIIADYLHTRSDNNVALFVSARGDRLAKRTIQDVLYRWCTRLGLTRVHVHQLRHTAITRLAAAGMTVVALKELAGHESITTTMLYLEPNRQRVLQEYFAATTVNAVH